MWWCRASTNEGWVPCDDCLASKFALAGAQEGRWVPDWSSDLRTTRARRDTSAVRAALRAVLHGAILPSPDAAFQLLDAAILSGEPAIVVKLMQINDAPVPLRLWRASDFLPCYSWRSSISGGERLPMHVLEPAVVHAASAAKIDLCSLKCDGQQERDDYYSHDGSEERTLLEAVVMQESIKIARVMLRAGGVATATLLMQRALQDAREADFQLLEKTFQLGLDIQDLALGVTASVSVECPGPSYLQWWTENPCPGECRYLACFELKMGPLDLAILHGQRELALHLAETGVDLTADGVFGIRGWLVDAVELLCPNRPSPATKQQVQSIAVDVFNLQVQRSINATMKVAAMPLFQAIGCFSRKPDGLVLRKHPAISMICGFMAQRPMLARLIVEDGQSIQVSETNGVDLIAAACWPPWLLLPGSPSLADPQIEETDLVQALAEQEEDGNEQHHQFVATRMFHRRM